MFRGFLILLITVAAMIAAVVGIVRAGMYRITADRRAADAAWHKPEPVAVSATTPVANAIVASETEEPAIPVSSAVALWAEDAKLSGSVQIVQTPGARSKGHGWAGPKDPKAFAKWKQRQDQLVSSTRHHLTNFNSPDDRAEWEVEIPKDGDYEVDLTYACSQWQAGAHFIIIVGDKELMFTTEGGRFETSFRIVKLGNLNLSSGKSTLVLRPTLNAPNHHPVINVQRVELIPLQQ